MDDEPDISYGFIDALTGEPVRLSIEFHSSDEYGQLEIPRFSSEPERQIYRVGSPAILALAVEESPMDLNATDRLPMFGDYATRMNDLIPVRLEETRVVIRDEDGRATGFRSEINATSVTPEIPDLIKCQARMMSGHATILRKMSSDVGRCSYMLAGDPSELSLFSPHIGEDVRLNGRRQEAFRVIAAEIVDDHLIVALGNPRYVFEIEYHEPDSSVALRR